VCDSVSNKTVLFNRSRILASFIRTGTPTHGYVMEMEAIYPRRISGRQVSSSSDCRAMQPGESIGSTHTVHTEKERKVVTPQV